MTAPECHGEVCITCSDQAVAVRVVELLPKEVYVPLPYSETLSAFRDTPFLYQRPEQPEPKPRYTVKLAVGQYYEPWILDVKRIE